MNAAVVGSGFGGLAAAIRLQTAGVETTVYEGRDLPGGRAYVYRDQGYTFDAGPTVITAPDCLRELFTGANRRIEDYVELLPVTPFYRLVWSDGTWFDYTGEAETLHAEIRRIAPDDLAGYERFHAYSKKVYARGYDELGAVPFLSFWDMVKVAPQLAMLRADKSVYSIVSRYVKSEHLRQALSFHPLLVGGHPYRTSAIYTLIHHLERQWGVWFPRGGTGALVQGLVKLFTELGGTLRLSTPVSRITVSGGPRPRHTVHTESDAAEYDLVVSNADVHHTYTKLYGTDDRARPMARKLDRMDWSMSLFVIYFGTSKRYPDLAHHTILFGKRYRELLDDIFSGTELADDFSLYLHAPTVTDPGMAPSGGEAFYVLSPVPHLGTVAIDWATVGPKYAARIYEFLEGHLPGLRESIVTERLFTPDDFRNHLNARHGSAFSVAPTLLQSAYFRPHNRDPRIPGLYLVGAGTHPGAGVPGVVNSAKATVTTALADAGR